ncbi:hypothetical protein [Blastococcus sp. SYSU DS0533]
MRTGSRDEHAGPSADVPSLLRLAAARLESLAARTTGGRLAAVARALLHRLP